MSRAPSYSHQEPTRLCRTPEEVASPDNYGPEKVPNEFRGPDSFEKISKVFGNPLLESFKEKHIVPVELVGFGPQKDKVRTIDVNRKLAPLFAAAFEKIKAANLPYVLHAIGGHNFRYQLNDSVRDALIHRPEYAELSTRPDFAGSWNIQCAMYDLSHQTFDEIIPYKKRFVSKKTLLSNHSWGNAIDLNDETNLYNHAKPFDMPRRIVEIMASFGFRWGGYYHDYMHFEYLRASVAGLSEEEPPQVFFPFNSEQKRESPLKYFFLNERGKGGYFPLGQQQNLHGGVHLEPDLADSLVPVQAAMPGYIVAARLMAPGAGGDNPVLQEATEGRQLGFVLIRHELAAIEDKKESEQVHPLYSLYMHLASPTWGAAGQQEFEKAPWLASFLKMQFGAVVDLDPNSADAGKTLWAEAKVEPDASSFRVQGRAQPLPAMRGERIMALGKPCPKDVEEAIEAFKEGSIVTFDRPLFPVAAGETIGFVTEGAPVTDKPPRYLHWEMFSLAGDKDGIKVLLKKLGKSTLFKTHEEHLPNNFLEMPPGNSVDGSNEVQRILGETGVRIVEELLNDRYGTRLQRHFNDGREFFQAGGASGGAGSIPFSYPFEIEFSNPHEYKGELGSGSCVLEVTYKKAGAALPEARRGQRITLTPDQKKVSLTVPAEADEIVLWSEHFFLDQPVVVKVEEVRSKRLESREALFEQAVAQRWRNLVLDHVNEWTPKGLVEQLDARKAAGYLDVPDDDATAYEELKKQYLPLSWWSRPKSAQDKFGEVPVLGGDTGKSLFGADGHLLPADAKIVSMHPVTALWLIDLLIEKEAIAFKKAWPPVTLKRDESTQQPLYLGLLYKELQPLVGMETLLVLVQHGYGTTDGANATDVTFWLTAKGEGGGGHAPLVLCRAPYSEGVALGRLRFPFWGQWEMYAANGAEQRFAPVQTGVTELTLPKPELSGETFALGTGKPDPSGKLRTLATGSFVIRTNWPAALAGYIVFEHWRVPKGGQPETPTFSKLAIPVIAQRPPEERVEGGLRYRGEFIVGVEKAKRNPKVTASYTFRDFVSHKTLGPVFRGDVKEFKLAVPLAQRLQALWELCRPKSRKEKALHLTVTRLMETGLSLFVAPASGDRADLDTLTEKLPLLPSNELFSADRMDAQGAIRLTYTPPRSSGPLGFEFDPGPVLGRLAAQVLSQEGDSLHVRPHFIAPNGGHTVLAGKAAVDGQADLIEASAEDIKAACGNDFLELVADKSLPPVSRFEFGDYEIKMGRGKLITEVRLHGGIRQWNAAGPSIKLNGGGESKGAIVGSVVRADWELVNKKNELLPGRWGATLEFSTGLANPKKVATPPPPVSWKIEVKPILDELTVEIKKSELRFVGKARCIPTDVDLQIVCERMIRAGVGQEASVLTGDLPEDGASAQPVEDLWEEDALITGSIRYTVSARAHFGRCTEAGVFEASLPKVALKKDSGPFRFTWRPRVAREGGPLLIHGIAVQAASAPVVTSSDLGFVK
ncbi:M15 family metallopeptidase [Archangium violaceum]|uniref:M15 family metallopeptidase n=1 Tax=Archangium violaceum TaxID=83451 RepID=UPI00193C3B18|nr:M15 family metallopeptidase [Archangium violaceum]QRK11820.1 M15 family metallopeptidase [Archangium violaceum]